MVEWVDTYSASDDPFVRAAERLRRSVKGRALPAQGPLVEAIQSQPTYVMEPDLLEAQQQGLSLPAGVAINDAGIPYDVATGKELPTVRRPNVLPVAKTPDGFTLAMPKTLDIVGNVMSPLAAGRVPVKAGEVVLGSGAVRTMEEAKTAQGPFFSSLERAVDSAKLSKANPDQWLGYLKNQPGVKSEELSWVLGNLPEGQISKEALQDIVKQNKIELKEVVKGDPNEKALMDPSSPSFNPDKLQKANPTKYHDWQLPGGENYREMLLTLPAERAKVEYSVVPNKDGVNFDVIRSIDGHKEDYLRAVPRNEAEDAASYGNQHDAAGGRYSVNTYKSSHWDEPNILAHVRMNDRKILEGGKPVDERKVISDWPTEKKVLHLEEIQSDWHQAGRKEGYKLSDSERARLDKVAASVDDRLIKANRDDIMGNPDLKAGLDQAVKDKIITKAEADDYLKLTTNERSTVPDAPFKKNWDELALKRMLHKAANEGYDAISWTPGEAQALRYQNDVRQRLNSVEWHNKNMGKVDPDGNKKILVSPSNGSEIELTVDRSGKIVGGHGELKGKNLDDVLGKDIASQVLEKGEGNIDAKGYVMNSKGMTSFYDKMLVDRANNLAKKYGAKVEQRKIKADPVYEIKNPKLNTNGDEIVSVYKDGVFMADMEKSEAASYISKRKEVDKAPTVHYLRITPELRAKAKEGFPLFSSTPILNPVDFDPFKKFDPESSDYDYQRAIQAGLKPQEEEGENKGHWGSVAPVTDEERKKYNLPNEAYVLLKGKNHHTWNLAVKGEEERGFVVKKFGNRYYSVPKNFKPYRLVPVQGNPFND